MERLYSYGDMPPWGEGPVQQKIHGHPEYIEQNFPLTDRFVHCRVTRSGSGANAVAESARVVRKEDHGTDEEEFHRQREVAKERLEEPMDAKHQHRDLRTPEMMGSRGGGNPLASGAVGAVALGILAVGVFVFRSQRKVTSKTS